MVMERKRREEEGRKEERDKERKETKLSLLSLPGSSHSPDAFQWKGNGDMTSRGDLCVCVLMSEERIITVMVVIMAGSLQEERTSLYCEAW